MIDDFSPKSLPDLVCLPQGGDDSDDVDDEAEPVQHLDAAATDDLFKHCAGQKVEYNNKTRRNVIELVSSSFKASTNLGQNVVKLTTMP